MSENYRTAGARAEQLAENFLREKGYCILKKNFRFGKVGEIDIVCCEDEMLVFVEVKARSNANFGPPESSITERKKAQIRRVAKAYLYVNGLLDIQCRFDVIAIDFINNTTDIRHWVNAFW